MKITHFYYRTASDGARRHDVKGDNDQTGSRVWEMPHGIMIEIGPMVKMIPWSQVIEVYYYGN